MTSTARFAICALLLAACPPPAQPPPDVDRPGDSPHAAFRFGPVVEPPPRPTGLNKNECSLELALTNHLFGVERVADCGNLPREATVAMKRAAQRCVLDAYRSGAPFRVTLEKYSYDSHDSAGFASRGGSVVSIFSRSSAPVAPWTMRAHLRIWSYGTLREARDCNFDNTLCLDVDGGHLEQHSCDKLETF